jgi:hypothetical protein
MSIDESTTPSIRELIEEIVEERLASIQGPQPASIVSYDEASQLAIVQPLVMSVTVDNTGAVIRKPRAQIGDVPVAYFGGSGGAITVPVKAGYTVLLVNCGVHLDRWMLSGGIVDPGFVDPDKAGGRKSDVIAISGLYDIAHLHARPNDAMVLHTDDLRLGSPGADDPVIRKSDLDALIETFNTHRHVVTVAGNATTQTGTTVSPLPQQGPITGSPVTRTE